MGVQRAVQYGIKQTGAEEVAAGFVTIAASLGEGDKAIASARKAWASLSRSLGSVQKRMSTLDTSSAASSLASLSSEVSTAADKFGALKDAPKDLAKAAKSLSNSQNALSKTTTQLARAQERVARSKPPAPSGVKEVATQYSILEAVIQRADAAASSSEGWKELNNRIENAYDTMLEFGASPEEAIQNLRNVQQVAGATGVSVASLAKIAEKFSDEAETTTVTTKNLADTLNFAALSGERVEDAARFMGLAAIGQTDALKRLDKQAQTAAKAIDDIVDPQMRAKLIAQQITLAQQRQNNILGKARQRWAAYKISLDLANPSVQTMWRGMKILGGAAIAVAVAIGGVLMKAMKTYASQNVRTAKAIKGTKKAWDDVLYNLGAIVLGYNAAGKNIKKTTGFLKDFNRFLTQNAGTVQSLVKSVAKGLIYAVSIGSKIVLGFASFVGIIFETIKNLGNKFAEVINDIVFFAQEKWLELQSVLGDDEAAGKLQELRSEYNRTRAALSTDWSFPLTEKIAGYIDMVDQLEGKAVGFVDSFGSGEKGLKSTGPRKRGGGGGGAKLPTDINALREQIAGLKTQQKSLAINIKNRQITAAQVKAWRKMSDAKREGFVLEPKTLTAMRKRFALQVEINALRKEDLKTSKEIAETYRQLGTGAVSVEEFIGDPETFGFLNSEAANLAGEINSIRGAMEEMDRVDRERQGWRYADTLKVLDAERAIFEAKKKQRLYDSNPLAQFTNSQAGNVLVADMKKSMASLDAQRPYLDQLSALNTQIGQELTPEFTTIGNADPEIQALQDKITLRQRELKAIQLTKSANEQALTQGTQLAHEFAAGLGAAIANGEGVGGVLKGSLSSALGSLVPMLQAYGAALVAAGSLNPVALFAATTVLAALVGAAQSALSGSSAPSTAASAPDRGERLRRDIQREEQQEQQINVSVNIGNELLDERTVRVVQQRSNLGQIRSSPSRRG